MHEQRDEYNHRQREEESMKIMEALQKQKEYIEAEKICIYLSKGSEVSTHEFVRKMLSERKKKVIVPVTDAQKKCMTLSVLNNINDLQKGTFNILEPKKIHATTPEEVDLFIIPGVAFDVQGYRIGYGGGYYDRLLSKVNKPKIGIAYSIQIVQNIPKNETDIPVDKIITEDKIYGKNT